MGIESWVKWIAGRGVKQDVASMVLHMLRLFCSLFSLLLFLILFLDCVLSVTLGASLSCVILVNASRGEGVISDQYYQICVHQLSNVTTV